jgi:hypothetical protein
MTRAENFPAGLTARRARTLFPALAFLLLAALGAASPVKACLGRPVTFSELFTADVVVRATAVNYVVSPADPTRVTTGVPDSTVEFKVEETLKGDGLDENLVLNGYLSEKDDFNENPVPYKFVRPGGRAGSCYANTYKQGAQFLLFLKKTAGGHTSNIMPLGPTNEQLRSETDPWLLWVRVRLNPCGKLREGDEVHRLLQDRLNIYEAFRGHPPLNVKYRAAKCYLQKYEAKDGPDDQYLTYIKKWVEQYERLEEQR